MNRLYDMPNSSVRIIKELWKRVEKINEKQDELEKEIEELPVLFILQREKIQDKINKMFDRIEEYYYIIERVWDCNNKAFVDFLNKVNYFIEDQKNLIEEFMIIYPENYYHNPIKLY